MVVFNSICSWAARYLCVCAFSCLLPSLISHTLLRTDFIVLSRKTTNQELVSCIINRPACWIFQYLAFFRRRLDRLAIAGAEIDGVSRLDSGLGWRSVVAGFLRREEKKKPREDVSCGMERDDSAVGTSWKFNDVLMAPQGHDAGATSQEGACENSNLERQGCSPFYQDVIDDPYVDPVSGFRPGSLFFSSFNIPVVPVSPSFCLPQATFLNYCKKMPK